MVIFGFFGTKKVGFAALGKLGAGVVARGDPSRAKGVGDFQQGGEFHRGVAYRAGGGGFAAQIGLVKGAANVRV